MIDKDGTWRVSVTGVRELVIPSDDWHQTMAQDPDVTRLVEEANTRIAKEADDLERLAVIEIQRKAIPAKRIAAEIENMGQRKARAVETAG